MLFKICMQVCMEELDTRPLDHDSQDVVNERETLLQIAREIRESVDAIAELIEKGEWWPIIYGQYHGLAGAGKICRGHQRSTAVCHLPDRQHQISDAAYGGM